MSSRHGSTVSALEKTCGATGTLLHETKGEVVLDARLPWKAEAELAGFVPALMAKAFRGELGRARRLTDRPGIG